ncbi:MAG: peptidoglycan DD-metalloendopeptidase family protein [Chloroflexia bacterium]|nr:peptidoglycan DD-metalloendopeptidase family protein [Chloroflexia bacterium]
MIEGPASFVKSANGWYRIEAGDLRGYVDGDLLAATEAPEGVLEPDDESDAEPERSETPSLEPDREAEPSDPEPEPAPTGPTGSFITPVDGTLTQGFGCSSLGYYVYDPELGCAVHDGLDIAAPTNTPILAADGGTVVFAGSCDCGLGNYVEIDHGDGVHTLYGHMAERPFVITGQQVSRGDVIGPVGSTGLATGPHVHFMVRVDGVSRDPAEFLP